MHSYSIGNDYHLALIVLSGHENFVDYLSTSSSLEAIVTNMSKKRSTILASDIVVNNDDFII